MKIYYLLLVLLIFSSCSIGEAFRMSEETQQLDKPIRRPTNDPIDLCTAYNSKNIENHNSQIVDVSEAEIKFENKPYIVEFKKSQNKDAHKINLDKIKQFKNSENVKNLKIINSVSLELSELEKKELEKKDYIKNIFEDRIFDLQLDSSVDAVYARNVWNSELALTGKNVKIGVIDTGIDYKHQDFGSCTSEEFLSGFCEKVVGGYDFADDDEDPYDDLYHGTHVAATVGGLGLYPGVAPDSELYALKVFSQDYSGAYESDIIAAMQWAMDPDGDGDTSDHLDIISMSLGGPGHPDDPLSLAADVAASEIVVVVSAGNSGPQGIANCWGEGDGSYNSICSPGTSRKAITVGAYCEIGMPCEGEVAPFSSRGPVDYQGTFIEKPDVVAPGVSICAAKSASLDPEAGCWDEEHIPFHGTSMAAPHVSGLAALLLEKSPELTPSEVKQMIMASSTDLRVDVYQQGAGLIRADTLVGLHPLNTPAIFLDYEPIVKQMELEAELIINAGDQELNIEFDSPSGILIDDLSVSQNPNETVLLVVPITVDNDIVKDGISQIGITINGNEVHHAEINLRKNSEIVIYSNKQDLGIIKVDGSSVSKNSILTIENKRTDKSFDFELSISCDEGEKILTNDLQINQFTIREGEERSFSLTHKFNTEIIAKGEQETWLEFESTEDYQYKYLYTPAYHFLVTLENVYPAEGDDEVGWPPYSRVYGIIEGSDNYWYPNTIIQHENEAEFIFYGDFDKFLLFAKHFVAKLDPENPRTAENGKPIIDHTVNYFLGRFEEYSAQVVFDMSVATEVIEVSGSNNGPVVPTYGSWAFIEGLNTFPITGVRISESVDGFSPVIPEEIASFESARSKLYYHPDYAPGEFVYRMSGYIPRGEHHTLNVVAWETVSFGENTFMFFVNGRDVPLFSINDGDLQLLKTYWTKQTPFGIKLNTLNLSDPPTAQIEIVDYYTNEIFTMIKGEVGLQTDLLTQGEVNEAIHLEPTKTFTLNNYRDDYFRQYRAIQALTGGSTSPAAISFDENLKPPEIIYRTNTEWVYPYFGFNGISTEDDENPPDLHPNSFRSFGTFSPHIPEIFAGSKKINSLSRKSLYTLPETFNIHETPLFFVPKVEYKHQDVRLTNSFIGHYSSDEIFKYLVLYDSLYGHAGFEFPKGEVNIQAEDDGNIFSDKNVLFFGEMEYYEDIYPGEILRFKTKYFMYGKEYESVVEHLISDVQDPLLIGPLRIIQDDQILGKIDYRRSFDIEFEVYTDSIDGNLLVMADDNEITPEITSSDPVWPRMTYKATINGKPNMITVKHENSETYTKISFNPVYKKFTKPSDVVPHANVGRIN